MPFATNALDGTRIYYEDTERPGPPLVFMYGLMDPVPAAKALPIARRLESRARMIYVDHRGHGRSDKPHDASAYAIRLRVADVVAVLDALRIDRAHFAGISWGARLGFALGEQAPERLHSLVLSGNQPFAWDQRWPIVQTVTDAIAAARDGGPEALLRWFEDFIGKPLPKKAQRWLLENDAAALDAAWTSALAEGDIAPGLRSWRTPCLIAAGEFDDFHDNARRAATEIPCATFVSLTGKDHITAIDEVDRLMPGILELLQS
jgi:pimeloyl-ACP methyl ester carboxylesterase